MSSETPTLADYVSAAWERHAKEAHDVAAGLREQAPMLSTGSDGAAALVLAEHVWLAHLHDAPGFAAFLASLPATLDTDPATAAALRRGRWVVAAATSGEAGELPDTLRWRALQNLWALWCAQGRVAQAQAQLAEAWPAALAHADAAARKALAATCWTVAQDLREGPRDGGIRDAFLIALATASRALWATAGTWVNVERGDWLLARCHAAVGQGPQAQAHAQACLALIEQHAGEPGADDFEFFFAHEALAWAQRAVGDAAGEAAQIACMQARLAAITDESLRPWCAEALAALQK